MMKMLPTPWGTLTSKVGFQHLHTRNSKVLGVDVLAPLGVFYVSNFFSNLFCVLLSGGLSVLPAPDTHLPCSASFWPTFIFLHSASPPVLEKRRVTLIEETELVLWIGFPAVCVS